MPAPNLIFVGQSGRLAQEAVILAASLRAADPGFSGRVWCAVPEPGPLWPADPRLPAPVRDLLDRFAVTILPFETRLWGHRYPQGNKIEALAALPADEPFLFLDTDTLITGALSAIDFAALAPAASMRRGPTWPDPPPYGPDHAAIWAALYRRFGLEISATLDTAFAADDWRRYLYFNAGWFFGPCPHRFGDRFAAIARAVETDPPEELAAQALFPWLDQIALPLVIHALGGGRPGPALAGMDGDATCHYRALPLLYARESDMAVEVLETALAANPVKKVLRDYEPVRRLVYQRKGRQVRAMFDRAALPPREAVLRNRIRAAGLWLR